jgi:hypothetical protein
MDQEGTGWCNGCDKKFFYSMEISRYYTTKQVPCLNGVPHDFKHIPHNDAPNLWRFYRCSLGCGNKEYRNWDHSDLKKEKL